MKATLWTMIVLGTALTLAFAGGCRKPPSQEAGPAENATTNPEQSADGVAAEQDAPKAMDAEDHPDAPRVLPRSSEVQGWIKTQAVQVATADQVAEFVEDTGVRDLLNQFQFERLARATYQSPHATAEVLLVEAKTPEDALGAFTSANAGADCSPREDGSLRTSQETDDSLVLTGWQGNVFLRINCKLEREEGRRQCQALLSRTIFGLPIADPPLLMQAVKEIQREDCVFWVVRSPEILQQQENPRLKQIDPAAMKARLGLEGDVLLSVVAVEQTEGAAPVIVWLAHYPSAEAAKSAADRYAQALESQPHGLDSVTFVGSPTGPYLMGTWTADQQAAREMVKLLEEVLPEQH